MDSGVLDNMVPLGNCIRLTAVVWCPCSSTDCRSKRRQTCRTSLQSLGISEMQNGNVTHLTYHALLPVVPNHEPGSTALRRIRHKYLEVRIGI